MRFKRNRTTTEAPIVVRRAIEEGEVYVNLTDIVNVITQAAAQYERESEPFVAQALQAFRAQVSAAYVEAPKRTPSFS